MVTLTHDDIAFAWGFVTGEHISHRVWIAALVDQLDGDDVFRARVVEDLVTPTDRDRRDARARRTRNA